MPIATTRFVDRAIQDAQGLKHPRRLGLPSRDNFPWDKIAFGYKINPDGDNTAEVGIYNSGAYGYLGIPATVNSVGAVGNVDAIQKFIIIGSQVISLKYIMGGGFTYDQSAQVPLDDATYCYKPLYYFTETNGVVQLDWIANFGNQIAGAGSAINAITTIDFSNARYKYTTLTMNKGIISHMSAESDWVYQ